MEKRYSSDIDKRIIRREYGRAIIGENFSECPISDKILIKNIAARPVPFQGLRILMRKP
jgi:hypothetical protein